MEARGNWKNTSSRSLLKRVASLLGLPKTNPKGAAVKYIIAALLALACADPQKVNLDKRLKTYKYPYKTKLFEYLSQTHKIEMAYMIAKPQKEKANGKTVVLMHGKNFSGAYWGQTAKDLVKRGYRVLIPDQVGFGRSSKPIQYQYSFHAMARATKKLLDWWEIEKAAVVGHSMGGMLAARFALMYPDTVSKLVLVNPIGLEDYKSLAPYQTVDEIFDQQLALTPKDVKNYQLKNYYDGKWKEEYDRWLKLQTGWIKGPDWQHLAYVSALTYDMIYTQPVVYELPKIQVPTLLIIGDRDRTALGKSLVDEKTREKMGRYRKLGPETAKKIPEGELVMLEGVGHLPHIEAYQEFKNALFSFL